MRKIVRALRNLLGYTLSDIAEVVGVNKSAIGNFETGISTLSNQTIAKICEFLGIDFEKKQLRRPVYYFSVKSDKDWVDFGYLEELAKELLHISDIVCFEDPETMFRYVRFVALYEAKTGNVYVVLLKKPTKKDVVETALAGIFSPKLIRSVSYTKELLDLVMAKKAKNEDLESYFFHAYWCRSRRIPSRFSPDPGIYVLEVPIDIILNDFWEYIKHEPDVERKKRYLHALISDVLLRTERPATEEEYKQELERRLKRAYELFNIKEK